MLAQLKSEWFDNMVLHELEVLGDDSDFIKTLLQNFEKEGSQHVRDIREAMVDDYARYRDKLHALKGSATELGANRLVDACLQGEALKPYDMGTEKIERMSDQIDDVFRKTIGALSHAAMVEQGNVYSKNLPEH